MMSRRNSSLLVGLGLLALLVAASLSLPEPSQGPLESFPVRDLARVVPKEAAAWVVIDGRDGELGYKTSDLKALLDKPSVQEFLAPYFTGLDQALKEEDEWIQQYAGLRLSEVLGLLRYRTTIAYCGQVDSSVPEARKVPNLLLTLEFDEDLALVRRLLFALEKAVLAWGSGTFHDEEILGIAAKRYDPLSMKGIQAWYFVEGRMLVLGTDLPTVEGVVGRLRGGSDEEALFHHPSFQELLSGLSPRRSMFWSYAVVGGIADALSDWEFGTAAEVVAKMPFVPEAAIGWRMRWVDSGVRDTVVVTAGLAGVPPEAPTRPSASSDSSQPVRPKGAIDQLYREPISGVLASLNAQHHAIPAFQSWWTYAQGLLSDEQRKWTAGKIEQFSPLIRSYRADLTLQVHGRKESAIPLVDLRVELPSSEAAQALTRDRSRFVPAGNDPAGADSIYAFSIPAESAAGQAFGAWRHGPYLHLTPSLKDAESLRAFVGLAGEVPPQAQAEGVVLAVDLAAVMKRFMALPGPIRRAVWPRRHGIGPHWKSPPKASVWDSQALRVTGELSGGRRMRLDLHSPAGLVGCAGLAYAVSSGWRRLSPWLRLLSK